jgi:hypothetical protein
MRAPKKLFHYREKFRTLSPAGCFIEDHDTHFISDPNASASTLLARQERRREKYIRANKKLTEVLRQLINNKYRQATTST